MENQEPLKSNHEDYRAKVNEMGKKEFTLLKMQEYGFWPTDLPTPYERKKSETTQDYEKRSELAKQYQNIVNKISKLYADKDEINSKLKNLKSQYDDTVDYEKIRAYIASELMKESIKKRAEKKQKRQLEKIERVQKWQKYKSDNIIFIGKGYSKALIDKQYDETKLKSYNLPIIKDDKDLAKLFDIEYTYLRCLAYHRDVVTFDNYYRYTIPKKSGGERNIAAPKSVLKTVQRKILEEILNKLFVSNNAHGFLKGKSVVSGAKAHITKPELLINMDIKDFFPTITFERVMGMFKSFGYSGYISSILAMLCTYCERVPIEIKGQIKYVKTSERILPQGSPASPMITNIICLKLDKRLHGLSSKFGYIYTRYADDMSFSSIKSNENLNIGSFIKLVSKIVEEEGFNINENKTRFLRKNSCQSITGIVINNDEIGVPKKWVKKLRATIYNANKSKLNGTLKLETINEISGMISWLKEVNSKRYTAIINNGINLLNNI